jgi:adenylate cyclase
MRNTIRQKILTMATLLLIVFAFTTGLSTYLVNQVVEEIEAITEYHIPLEAQIADLDVLAFEYELDLRRLLTQDPINIERVAKLSLVHREIRKAVVGDIEATQALLQAGVVDTRNDLSDRLALAQVQGSFSFLEKRAAHFLETGDKVLTGIEAGDFALAEKQIGEFDAYEGGFFGTEIAKIRKTLEQLTFDSVIETKNNQVQILSVNIALFAASATIGLSLFLVLTGRLQRSFAQLLDGTNAVKTGDLAIELPVNSKDEIGQLAKAFNHMVIELNLKEQVKDTFGQYIDPRIVSRLIASHGDQESISERRPATIFFSDIKGFTRISEQLTANSMVNLLNNYFTAVTQEIHNHNGIVDKYIGDAVMAFWAEPFSDGDCHAADGCLAALAQQQALKEFRSRLGEITGLRRDIPDFTVRMGLATGEVVLGTVGSDISKSYTVIGDIVNTASRLEGVNKVFGTRIVVSDETAHLAQHAVKTRELDLIKVVGKAEPVRVHQLVCKTADYTAELTVLADTFAAGLAAYRAQDWHTATHHFSECLALQPSDGPSQLFLTRIAFLKDNPPEQDWAGIWDFGVK